MKTIGIVGGLGPESTVDYYKGIIGMVATKYPRFAYPEIIIYSVNMNEVMKMVNARQWPKLVDVLLCKIDALHRSGAQVGAIASNTPHIVFDEINKRSPIPLVSIVEATCAHAQALGFKRCGLLGTKLTMESYFYEKRLSEHGITVFVPSGNEQRLIHHRIFSEIELGVFKDTTKDELLAITKRMIDEEKIDALILGCTELPLILTESPFMIPFLNTTEIHCGSIVEYSIG